MTNLEYPNKRSDIFALNVLPTDFLYKRTLDKITLVKIGIMKLLKLQSRLLII